MRVVLAYSGGLDTTACIVLLREKWDAEVITVTVDVGQSADFSEIEKRAYRAGAAKHYTIDAKEEFANEYIARAILMNGMYEGRYPLSTALARPLIAAKVVEVARRESADAVAHGSTSKGNDQVRFDLAVKALAPDLQIITPIRRLRMTRAEAMELLRSRGIDVPTTHARYSVDDNLWGRSIEGGPLDDPSAEPPEDAFEWTKSPQYAPDNPEVIEIEFEKGLPVAVNGEKMPLTQLVKLLNEVAGRHGVGRIDHVENRVVGLKTREVYEAPAAVTIYEAHRDLEKHVLTPRELRFKHGVLDPTWADLVYQGLWFEPLREAVEAAAREMEKWVTGTVKVRLFKGSATVVGRSSPYTTYEREVASYEGWFPSEDEARGFIELWGMHSVEAFRRRQKPGRTS